MPDPIKFKEPERCDYVYIDENNKVHLMMPLVGGVEIGLDNTCQTGVELNSFFHGSTHEGVTRFSAQHHLAEYAKLLKEDIQEIEKQRAISPLAFETQLKVKKERLKQVNQYIELITVLKKDYDTDKGIKSLQLLENTQGSYPPIPKEVSALVKSATNGFAVRLSPFDNDPLTLFNDPIFSVKRNISKWRRPDGRHHLGAIDINEGLGSRLRSTFYDAKTNTGSPILPPKTLKEKVIEDILAKANLPDDYLKEPDTRDERLTEVKKIIQEELAKVNKDISVDKSTIGGMDIDASYLLDLACTVGEDDPLKEWIGGVIGAATSSEFWDLEEQKQSEAISVFYDGEGKEVNASNNDRMSVKVQFLLAEANIFCKLNKLSDANFGAFFDEEPHATNIAKNVKEGLGKGANIEKVIFDYINTYHAQLGLKNPLTEEQQKEITEQFTKNYNTIKDSPHFDEFFIADTSKKGALFNHQNRISLSFLEFFQRQTKGKHPLGGLEGHVEALHSGSTNNLSHKNEVGYEKLEQFKTEVVRLLAENKPKELIDYLTQQQPGSKAPNYSMLTLETQNYIAYNRNGQEILRALEQSDANPKAKQELGKLISPTHVKHENLANVVWSKVSTKPLFEVELNRVASGISATVTNYEREKNGRWFQRTNKVRDEQIQQLKEIAQELNKLAKEPDKAKKEEVVNSLLKSIMVLDKIDADIGKERNLFKSSLQREVVGFKKQLQEMCQLENYAIKPTPKGRGFQQQLQEMHSINLGKTPLDLITTFVIEEQFNKISNQEVQKIVRDLPHHCHTDQTIEFFAQLTSEEANKVASYLNLEYRELTQSTDKQKLLTEEIPQAFKEINERLLSGFKQEGVIDEGVHEKLLALADKIPPELVTKKNLEKWSTTPEMLNDTQFGSLLKEAQSPTSIVATRDFRRSIDDITGRTNLDSTHTQTLNH
ncbi:protein SdcA [Legionella sainthelensi]|uniref:protein SdcA n=1 Tax=Legionella sainthelensi TaxID=28087 RepID=UPI000E205B31|nr:protein SdcA [Legionella sainthelensi]